ncbi:MAG: hypothetical protein FWG98_10085 [Candidatus Cloacimonetes bacterium]|nr:hypothetical protein [Candidatus Cloacimonadota bacterium]
MRNGIGFTEILLILVLIVIFVNPKDIPDLLRKILKIVKNIRSELKKIFDEFNL